MTLNPFEGGGGLNILVEVDIEADFGRDCGYARLLCVSCCFNALMCLIFIDAQDARITVAARILPVVMSACLAAFLNNIPSRCLCWVYMRQNLISAASKNVSPH